MARLLIIDVKVICDEASIISLLLSKGQLGLPLSRIFSPELNPYFKKLLLEKTSKLSQLADGGNLKIAFICSSPDDVKTIENTFFFDVLNSYFEENQLPIFHIEDKEEENEKISNVRINKLIEFIRVYYGGECSNTKLFSDWLHLFPRAQGNYSDSLFKGEHPLKSQEETVALTPSLGQ